MQNNKIKLLSLTILVSLVFFGFSNFTQTKTKRVIVQSNDSISADTIVNWLTWEEAIKKNDTVPKKIFMDIYTNWCGWCTKMDNSTFKDAKVVEYLNEKFHCVKFDAESKKEIVFKGHTFKYTKTGRRGYHELAISLLDSKMSFPSFVLLNKEVQRINILPGYRTADEILIILKYIGEDYFKTMTYDEYLKSLKKDK